MADNLDWKKAAAAEGPSHIVKGGGRMNAVR